VELKLENQVFEVAVRSQQSAALLQAAFLGQSHTGAASRLDSTKALI